MSGFCFQNESPDHLNNNLIYLLKWKRNVISYHNYHMKKTDNFLKVDSLLVSESSYFFCNGKCQLGVAALGFFFFRWCTLTQNLGSNTKKAFIQMKNRPSCHISYLFSKLHHENTALAFETQQIFCPSVVTATFTTSSSYSQPYTVS